MNSQNNKTKKLFTYIGKLFSFALLVILIIVGLFLAYYLASAKMVSKNPNYEPKFTLYTIVSGSMEPNIRVYDIILDKRIDSADDIKIGDVITFKSTSSISRDLIVTHRVIDIKVVNGKYEYVTKGDFNATADSDTAKMENIIGKVIIRFPQLGRLQFFVATKMGWFIIVLLPAACVIIYDIIKLIKLIGVKTNVDNIITKDNKIKMPNKDKKINNAKTKKDIQNNQNKSLNKDTIKDYDKKLKEYNRETKNYNKKYFDNEENKEDKKEKEIFKYSKDYYTEYEENKYYSDDNVTNKQSSNSIKQKTNANKKKIRKLNTNKNEDALNDALDDIKKSDYIRKLNELKDLLDEDDE